MTGLVCGRRTAWRGKSPPRRSLEARRVTWLRSTMHGSSTCHTKETARQQDQHSERPWQCRVQDLHFCRPHGVDLRTAPTRTKSRRSLRPSASYSPFASAARPASLITGDTAQPVIVLISSPHQLPYVLDLMSAISVSDHLQADPPVYIPSTPPLTVIVSVGANARDSFEHKTAQALVPRPLHCPRSAIAA